MENKTEENSTSPVSPEQNQTPPVIPDSIRDPENLKKPKPKLPLLIIGVVIFLLLAGSAAGFYVFKNFKSKNTLTPIIQKQTVSPTPNPTVWKTYEDKINHFTLNYPPTWDVKNGDFYIHREGVGWAAEGPVFTINITKQDTTTSSDFKTWSLQDINKAKSISIGKSSTFGTLSPVYSTWIRLPDTIVDSKTTIVMKNDNPFNESGCAIDRVALIENNNSHLVISAGCTSQKEFLDQFAQILSTFKFTDINPSGKSGVEGHMSLGPTCPVERPGASCEKDYQGTVIVKSLDGTREITRFSADQQGNFHAELLPGTYLLEPVTSSSGFPIAKSQTVTITNGTFTKISIQFDTGIR